MINRFFCTELAKIDSNHDGNVFILDGTECRTSNELIGTGYSNTKITVSNDSSSYDNIKKKDIVKGCLSPLSAQNYFGGKYKKFYPISKEGFAGIYLDFCGQINQLNGMERIFDHMAKKCILTMTLTMRGEKDTKEKTKAWIEEETRKKGFRFESLFPEPYVYHSMFTLMYLISSPSFQ